MPGIVGLISGSSPESCRDTLDRMVGTLMHEPFYRNGAYTHEGLGLYAGWACHPGSFADCMPATNEKRDIVLIFSGENFMDRDILSRLRSGGHQFDSHEAGSLVHLYEESEKDFFKELNGCFNGVIVDLRKPSVTLFNDRFGLHRVYYAENHNGFLFASEAKSILRVCPDLREIDPRSLGEFFSCECVLENRSLFKGIKILPGGSAWTFAPGRVPEKKTYFRPEEWEGGKPLEREEFCRTLKHELVRIIPRYLQGKQPVGISLTGGLDSRMIMAFLDGKSANTPCYTFGSESRDSLDVRISRKVARACGQEHAVLRLGKDFLARFPEEARRTVYISDGALDACGCYELYLNAKARQIAPVRMTGNWGSELLRGARAFKAGLPYRKVFDPDFYPHIQEAVRTFDELSRKRDLSFSLFVQAPWHSYGRLAVEQSQLTQRTPYLDKDFAELMYRVRKEDRFSDTVTLRLIGETSPKLLEIRTDRGAAGNSGVVSTWFWRAFYEAAFKAEYYCGHGMPRWLSRWDRGLRWTRYDRLFLGRNKFQNYRQWFMRELADYIRGMLLEARTLQRPYLKAKSVEEMIQKHLLGRENYLDEINKTLTVELVHRLFLDG